MRFCVVLGMVAMLVSAFFTGWFVSPRRTPVVESRTDTLYVRDTIRDTILTVRDHFITHIERDTLRLAGDTVFVAVEIPIEQKTYETPDYRAVIEGYKPFIMSMEVFPVTRIVTNTETVVQKIQDNKRWGFGPYIGYGIIPVNGIIKHGPSVGLSIHYSIIQW